MSNKQTKTWAERSPEERDNIIAQRASKFKNPFNGKNKAQRQRLHHGFAAMRSVHNTPAY